jgi:hypothetical protein
MAFPTSENAQARQCGCCAPQFGNQYTPEEATQILLDFKRKKVQIKSIIKECIANQYIPIEWSAMNDRVNNALKHENAGSNFVEFVRPWGESGRPNLANIAQTGDERKAENRTGDERKAEKRPQRGCWGRAIFARSYARKRSPISSSTVELLYMKMHDDIPANWRTCMGALQTRARAKNDPQEGQKRPRYTSTVCADMRC